MLVLVTGGSGSGKSAFAEDRVLSFGEARRIYIATMQHFDEEGEKRVARHRKMRAGKGFETMERYTDLKNLAIPPDSVVLLECMSNLSANEMFAPEGAHENTASEIIEGVRRLQAQARHVVIVTNEIFSTSASYEGEMEEYLRTLGKVNQEIVKMADEAVEVVYGIPVYMKKVPEESMTSTEKAVIENIWNPEKGDCQP